MLIFDVMSMWVLWLSKTRPSSNWTNWVWHDQTNILVCMWVSRHQSGTELGQVALSINVLKTHEAQPPSPPPVSSQIPGTFHSFPSRILFKFLIFYQLVRVIFWRFQLKQVARNSSKSVSYLVISPQGLIKLKSCCFSLLKPSLINPKRAQNKKKFLVWAGWRQFHRKFHPRWGQWGLLAGDDKLNFKPSRCHVEPWRYYLDLLHLVSHIWPSWQPTQLSPVFIKSLFPSLFSISVMKCCPLDLKWKWVITHFFKWEWSHQPGPLWQWPSSRPLITFRIW